MTKYLIFKVTQKNHIFLPLIAYGAMRQMTVIVFLINLSKKNQGLHSNPVHNCSPSILILIIFFARQSWDENIFLLLRYFHQIYLFILSPEWSIE